jgi:farnesol dehydrogenase
VRLLVTGGTGFLGRALVRRLAAGGHQVALLARPSSDREGFPPGIEWAEGDVTDRASLDRAFAGRDAVVHAAALVKILAPGRDFDRVNVEGLDNVLAAAEATGVGRMVYVSSFMAFGPTEALPGGEADESTAPRERRFINHYERTKTRADRRARQAIAAGAPLSVVYPGVIYGPGALTEGNIVVRHLLDLAAGKLPGLLGSPERRWNYVFVDDVAEGIARVVEGGSGEAGVGESGAGAGAATGQRWVLGGETVTQRRFYDLVEQVGGIRFPRRRIPDTLASFAGLMMREWARLSRGTPQLTPDLVEIYRHDWALDSARAAAGLGWRGRSLEQGLTETVAWLREEGRWPT